jgi:ABC-2 type transport system ATP-binding protein
MDPISVSVISVTKKYGEETALDSVTFEIKKGELFGFIGPDGAGKTTLFRILTTLLLPDQGKATVDGLDVVRDFKKLRRIIGYMPGRFSLYMDLTVEENLNFYATIFGTTLKENYHLVKPIYSQIEAFRKRKAGQLSGGMKQKLALSCALIHKPSVLFLDEPTTGVDAVSRVEFWEMLKNLKEEGITILVSTPYMDEASLCDRVALIQHGKILNLRTPVQIVDGFPYDLINVRSRDIFKLLRDLKTFPGIVSCNAFGQSAHVSFPKGSFSEKPMRDFLKENDHSDIEIGQIRPNIEDCFMELMGKNEKLTTEN